MSCGTLFYSQQGHHIEIDASHQGWLLLERRLPNYTPIEALQLHMAHCAEGVTTRRASRVVYSPANRSERSSQETHRRSRGGERMEHDDELGVCRVWDPRARRVRAEVSAKEVVRAHMSERNRNSLCNPQTNHTRVKEPLHDFLYVCLHPRKKPFLVSLFFWRNLCGDG